MKNPLITADPFAARCLSIVLVPVILAGCEGATLGHFNSTEDIATTRIQGQGLANVLPASFPPIALDVTATQDYDEADFDYVTSIQVSRLQFSIHADSENTEEDQYEDGQPDNFDFLQSMDIVIRAEIDGVEREERVAFLSGDDPQIGSQARTLTFTSTGVDILPFVQAQGGYEMQTSASGAVPPDDVIFDGRVSYRVGIGFN